MSTQTNLHGAGTTTPIAYHYPERTTGRALVTLRASDGDGNTVAMFFNTRTELIGWLSAACAAVVALPEPGELSDPAVDRLLADINDATIHVAAI